MLVQIVPPSEPLSSRLLLLLLVSPSSSDVESNLNGQLGSGSEASDMFAGSAAHIALRSSRRRGKGHLLRQ